MIPLACREEGRRGPVRQREDTMAAAAEITVRPAGRADVPSICGLLSAFQEEARAFDAGLDTGERLGTPAVAADLLESSRRREGLVLLAEIDGIAVGFASCALEPQDDISLHPDWRRVMELNDLYVVPGARRQGVGRRLAAAVGAHARSCSARRLSVVAYAGNAAALELYRRAGFADHQLRLIQSLDG